MNIDNIKLGFSTGTLHKTHSTKEALKIMRSLGYDTVELGFVNFQRIKDGWLDEISAEDLIGFKYVSLHAPKLNYGNNSDTELIFEKIGKINKIRKLDTVVFHPDPVEDFNVFKNVKFSVSFENMDDKKVSHQKPKDFEKIFPLSAEYRLVLDVNHIYTNDKSMKLAERFYEKFGDRISQFHVSGYTGYHDPLFKTGQTEIVKAISDFNIPMIIESVISAEDLEKERNCIIKLISGL